MESETNFSKSSRDVASAGITLEFVFSASSLIWPILIATGALVKTNVPPSSKTRSAVIHAIEFGSNAPKMIPFFPLSKPCDI